MRVALGASCSPAPNSSSAGCAFEDLDLETRPGERQRRGQPADPGAGDERAAGHGSRRLMKFALGGNRVAAERGVVDESRRAIGANRFRSPPMSMKMWGWSNGGLAPVHMNSFTPTLIVATPGSL